MDDHKVQSFTRIFRYVWPQWPRLVVIIVSAIVIGVLFSLSFMTIMPLLKVMMGEEGLHGWIDRKTCDSRYGMDFYVPDTSDYVASESKIAYYLRVTSVAPNSPADEAGIRPQDRIIGAGKFWRQSESDEISSVDLLMELAMVGQDQPITIEILRDTEGLGAAPFTVELPTQLPDKMLRRMKVGLADHAQRTVGFLPRDPASANKADAVIFIIFVMAGVTVARCLARFWQGYLAEKVVQVSIANLRNDAFAHVMEVPVGYFAQKGTSDTISRIVGDTSSVGKGVKILLGKALREPLKAIGCLAGAAMFSWQLTLIFLTCAPVTIGLFGVLGKKIKKATKRSLMSSAVMLGRLQGAINALRVVKVYNRQKHETTAYSAVNKRFLRQVLRIAKVQAGTNPLMEVLGMFAMAAALIVGSLWVFDPTKNMGASEFLTLLVLLGTSAESIRKVSDVWNRIQQANAAAERVYGIIDEPVEHEADDAVELAPLSSTLEFKDIVFTYPGNDKPTLNRINLTVDAGRTVAVVGPNGSGKTTLVNLIPRFYDVDTGEIFLDGVDIRGGTLKSLRDQIGMVTQNVVAFNDTIAANIAYGRPNATREEIIAAAKRSYCHEFIEPLPDGYDTMIGEQGSGFSGGQLQRIVIARAILKNPAILIFDEAMSQVDADSESKIHKAMEDLIADRTCFVIAHRFSTVISAELIVVMDEGRIVAKGTHEELVEKCMLYRNLYETQLMVPESA
ncbi:MAG: ATP-binding cassette domain-containing protein [Planctomycetes bacterium]|nr:ATP-binding cassette domain-containing protein [Planctomycetota bacterium]